MSDNVDVYLGFAFFAGVLLYMLVLYVQTRRPESLLSGQHRVTRFEKIVSGILSIATWPVVAAITWVALRDDAARTMNLLRDPWNPDLFLIAGVLLALGRQVQKWLDA